MIAGLREWAYRARWIESVRLPAYVVSVGNLSMGGTGKTPFVILLAEWARSQGLRTAILSRGYKRQEKDVQVVGPGAPLPPVEALGDEPWMMRARVPEAALLVHPDRARLAPAHWAALGRPQLVLLDDGFQHWKAQRDRDVVMLDATESLSQATLPFGRLREKAQALGRAELVVITRAKMVSAEKLQALRAEILLHARHKQLPVWKRSTAPLRILAADYEFTGFFRASDGQPCARPQEKSFLLASGIAKPQGLRFLARNLALPVAEELYFPDHHPLGEADKKRLEHAATRGQAVLMTEKDWARWAGFFQGGPKAYGLSVRLKFLDEGEALLRQFLAEVMEGACSI